MSRNAHDQIERTEIRNYRFAPSLGDSKSKKIGKSPSEIAAEVLAISEGWLKRVLRTGKKPRIFTIDGDRIFWLDTPSSITARIASMDVLLYWASGESLCTRGEFFAYLLACDEVEQFVSEKDIYERFAIRESSAGAS